MLKFSGLAARSFFLQSLVCSKHKFKMMPSFTAPPNGGKDGNPPNMAIIFFETHKKDNTLVEPEASKKYAEIKELVQSEPSLTNIEVVERYFGPQNKSHVIGLGGGITTKELKGGSSSKAAILTKLNATRKAKESL